MNNLIVSVGEQLTAALWNAFWKERRMRRLTAGPGVFIRDTGDGQVISFRPSQKAFRPNFNVSLAATDAVIGMGFVNGLEPQIDGRPISGILADGSKDPKGVPRLKLGADLFDATGRSFIVIRAQIDPETGKILEPDEDGAGELGLTIMQRAAAPPTDPEDDTIGYHRLAVLRRPKAASSGLGALRQIAMFDYQHRTARQGEKWVHFFDPA